jgi:hypothetical protein
VLEDGLQVLLLAHVPGRYDLAESRSYGAVLEEIDERGRRLLLQDPDGRLEVRLLRGVPALDEPRELREKTRRQRRALRVARDGDLAPARGDLDAEGVLEEPEVFVVNTEERAEPRLGEGERYGVGSD